ncbi:hypothetical protein GLW08_19915 [Pontibacillus yanchengensis]|uniref:Uncharacterized protein n=1 Tax=Pontibacillus yanchengensis TaxID=462910 RepID=A0ACC7VL83_9BACI|nr:hypothetical protein [Pontibacillus yanchengensis]MYL55572.1 hypothetical protein [Pontibacillus yanchengensis]
MTAVLNKKGAIAGLATYVLRLLDVGWFDVAARFSGLNRISFSPELHPVR